jgi:hypothetical protein
MLPGWFTSGTIIETKDVYHREAKKMSVKLTWYGHATLGLETSGYKLVIDPFFSR